MNMKIGNSSNWWIIISLLMSYTSMLHGAEIVSPTREVLPTITNSNIEITLQDDQMSVGFDSGSGALTRLEDKTTHWAIERRPELGVSFRMFAPLPDRRWNPILGQKQRATEVKKISKNELHIKWEDPVGESSGALPIELTADITLTNGALIFNAALKNNSALTVETIDYPYFGDLNAPTRVTPLQLRVMTNSQSNHLKMDELYPHFGNEKGYWGVFWPVKTREAQASRFCLISAANEGLYLDTPATPYRLQWTFEQHPGLVSSINNLVPPEDEISGTPVHLEFRACHFIFAAPDSTVKLTPIALRCYQGDWRSGAGLYEQAGSRN
jgi:hypothetical protein